MTPEEAKARAHALLTVIETSYGITIVNIEAVIAAITGKTLDEQQILAICTVLNTWVAINAGVTGDVLIPLDVLNGLAERVLGSAR